MSRVKILGLYFGHKAHRHNVNAIGQKVNAKISLWHGCYDYWPSRIAVYKNILFGTCVYYGSVYTLDSHFSNANSQLFRFVWARKPEWVSRELMYNSKANGGWGMFNPSLFSLAAQLKQFVCCLTVRDHPVKHLYRFFLGFSVRYVDPSFSVNSSPKCVFPPPFVKVWCNLLKQLASSNTLPTSASRVSEIYRLVSPDVPFQTNALATSASFQQSTMWGRCFDKAVPERCTNLQWRLLHDALPTMYKLSICRVKVRSSACPVCTSSPETVAHLFYYCPLARSLWGWLAPHLGLTFLSRENVVLHVLFPQGNTTPYVTNLLVHLSKFELWVARCRRLYEGKITSSRLLQVKVREALRFKLLSDFKTLRRRDFLSLWDSPNQTLWRWEDNLPTLAF